MKGESLEGRIELEMRRLLAATVRRFARGKDADNKKALNDMTLSLAQEIARFKGPHKYVVNSILFEKGSNDIVMSGICLWNNRRDRHVKFEIEHQDFTCIITVWIVSFQ